MEPLPEGNGWSRRGSGQTQREQAVRGRTVWRAHREWRHGKERQCIVDWRRREVKSYSFSKIEETCFA